MICCCLGLDLMSSSERYFGLLKILGMGDANLFRHLILVRVVEK
jgi:hypothetical protein